MLLLLKGERRNQRRNAVETRFLRWPVMAPMQVAAASPPSPPPCQAHCACTKHGGVPALSSISPHPGSMNKPSDKTRLRSNRECKQARHVRMLLKPSRSIEKVRGGGGVRCFHLFRLCMPSR